MTDTNLNDISFSSLHLPEPLARGIADAGFERCTPIQAQSLPKALAGLDVAGQAQTGTGKTAAFLVALFAKLMREPGSPERPVNSPRALILAPTRELALQIHKDAEILGQYTGLTLGLAFGGVDYDKQRRILEAGVDVLIGTPGRIIDYFRQHVFDLRFAQVLVLDEADRMFDLGFIKDIRFLLRRLPPADRRLSMLFSATLSHRVLELAFEHMNEPEFIRIEPERITAELVRQVIYYPAMEEKAPLLVHLMRTMGATRSMVFINTKRVAERLERVLQANGIRARAMSGDVPQSKRMKMLADFHGGDLDVLVATDVAARGLHIPDVSHVFNYDLPQDPEDYVHRIGRTARAGAAGDAVSFGCEQYVVSLPDIEAFIGRSLPVASYDRADLPHLKAPAARQFDEEDEAHRERLRRNRERDGGGGRRPGGGGGGGGGFRRGPAPRRDSAPASAGSAQGAPHSPVAAPAAAPRSDAPAPAQGVASEGGGPSGAPRKRRRRRGGGGGSAGGGGAPGGAGPAPAP